ncbi:DNA primase [Paenibacillus selenitireducens]|uniref:DNA primase n=1 Tax=Paenibacillus selenitireducens TaxID=1324314 RepID=A0A1T2XEV5_9BACL|nr:DNA primase [Paenibacillus selenitireducens]OPA78421.1 DNA primase [Paenibacillus selenitireducens]
MSTGNGNIPEDVIEAVLQQHDIVDVVGKYVHLTKQGKYMKGLCPFHSEKTPSFTVTPDKQIFHCYGCGKGGNAIKFVMEIESYSFPEAVRTMAEDANIPISWNAQAMEQSPRNLLRDQLLKAHELTAMLYHFLLKNSDHGQPAMEYLRQRGFTDKLIDQFQIGYAPNRWDTLTQFLTKRGFDLSEMEQGGLLSMRSDESGYVDRFRDRIMFPIWDRNGKVIAFGGRMLHDGQPKYLNSPESMLFNKSRVLYNLHHAKPSIRKAHQIVLFEGYVDVIQAWDAGVTNGIATMGTALTSDHLNHLKNQAEEVVVCYDGDDAGQAAAMKAIPMLEKAGFQARVAVLPDRLDPDEYIKEHGKERFRHQIIEGAVTPTKFKLIYLKKSHILLEDSGKQRYVSEATKLIAEIQSPTEREVYLKELAQQFPIFDYETLKQECNEFRITLQKKKPVGDNNDNWWNNVMNEKRVTPPPNLLPAYHNAERTIIALMLQDLEVTRYVQERLGDEFNVEDHAAIAAYLYAYYAQGKEPDISRFISSLLDDRLEKIAISISMMEVQLEFNPQVLDDYIREIQKVPRLREVKHKRDEVKEAERAGDFLRAAQIASEIIALERDLK